MRVTSSGLLLNHEDVNIEQLWARCSKIHQKRQLIVQVDTALAWGETWMVIDTLKALSRHNPNLTVKGIEEFW